MSAWRAILLHELRLRPTMPVLALALGVICAVVAPRALEPSDARFASLATSATIALAVALLTGASALGGYLGTGRTSFYFVRPLSWWTIWSARFAACMLLTGGCALLALLPWLVTRPTTPDLVPLSAIAPWPALAANALLAIGLAGAAAVARQARMVTRLLHVGLFALVAGVGFALLDTLRYGVWALVGRDRESLVLWPAALALVTGLAIQARAGRADPRRGHWSMAATAWGLLTATFGGIVAAGTIVTHATPAALSRFDWATREGQWIVVGGPVFGSRYPAAFLLEPRSGRFLRLGPADRVGPFDIAPGGGSGFVQRGHPFDPWQGESGWGSGGTSWTGLVLDGLAADGPRVSAVVPIERPSAHVYATDGGCVFLWRSNSLRWYCDGRAQVFTPRFGYGDNHGWEEVVQGGDGIVRALFGSECVLMIEMKERRTDLDDHDRFCVNVARDGQNADFELCESLTGTFSFDGGTYGFDPSGTRILHARPDHRGQLPYFPARAGEVALLDGRTGRRVARLLPSPQGLHASFTPGGVALASLEGGRAHARLFTKDGSLVKELDLGPAKGVEWMGRTGDAHAFALVSRPAGEAIVSIDWRGMVREEGGLARLPRRTAEVSGWKTRPFRSATDFFVDASGHLVELDPERGLRQTVLTPR